MTTANTSQAQVSSSGRSASQARHRRPQSQRQRQNQRQRGSNQPQPSTNVAAPERAVSIAAGAVLAALGVRRHSIPGVLIASLGGAMVYRGVSGHCDMYQAMGVDTAHAGDGHAVEQRTAERGIHVEQAYLINRPPETLYQYWRNFSNLPNIMTHLQKVEVRDDRLSHWVASAPTIAGGSVEWDAEITADEPNSRIAWRSLPGSEIDTVGEIRFMPGMGDRGTEVHVSMDYVPPAGRIGHWLATLFGESPWRQMRHDLRNFKRLMETGEIITISGQPRGSCTGLGNRREK